MQVRADQASAKTESGIAFNKNRARIGYFFETQHLRNLLKEFFAVQHSFHSKMHHMMMAFHDQSGNLSEEQQQLLEKLLYPYGILIANPFEENPTGDIEKDVTHILGIINARNEHFSKILAAMFLATANMPNFNLFLQQLMLNTAVKSDLLEGIHSKSWQDMEGHVALPCQNLMRYRLLLDQIRKELVSAGCESVEPVLMNIMNAITYIMPELKYINEHRDTLQYLNDIDALLVSLIKIEALQGCVTENDNAHGFPFPEKVDCVRKFIDRSILEIANGKGDVIEMLKALQVALETLQEGTGDSLASERSTYYSQGYHLLIGISATMFGENTVFAKPDLDPREKLPIEIAKLQLKIRELESARDAYQYLQERDPGFEKTKSLLMPLW